MDEWWTYTLSDFLLFSPRTYYRMLERHNEAVWPGQILTLMAGFTIVVLLRRSAPWQGRVISGLVSILWGWVAWSFFWERYAAINWAATYLAGLFAAEALLLAWIGVVRGNLRFRPTRDAAGLTGLAILVLALALYPTIAALLGRSLHQGEIFGIAPDPTVLATLGLLLLSEGRGRRWLLVVPVLWCAISGATLWAMSSPEALIPPLIALTMVIMFRR